MHSFDLIESWPGAVRGVIVRVRRSDGGLARAATGHCSTPLPWASVTKVAVAYGVLRAVQDGLIALDDEAGPAGATVEQLLCHAGGIGPSSAVSLCPPGTRRIYSNAGYELLAAFVERWSGQEFAEYLTEAVLAPLGLSDTMLEGSPASGLIGTVDDLDRLLVEVMDPTLLNAEMVSAMRSIHFPELGGVLPGFGRFHPCPWGLGLEIKGAKDPHWTGRRWGPSTVGHFGQSGSFLVVDPDRALGVVTLGDEPFGPWAANAWPGFLDAVFEEALDQPA